MGVARPKILLYNTFSFPEPRGCILSSEHVERRLAAILAADVAGSCRLIGINEEGTLAQLKALRNTLFDPKIAEHHGRIVKNTGDGALVEFASVVDAVRCAAEIQRGMAEQNTDMSQDKRIEFRVGIHVGDIIIEDDDIFGDAVNIAVRLEGIAEPGGVSISDDTHRQIRGKVDIIFEDIGLQSLKNIAEPMRVWRARIGPSPSPIVTKPPRQTVQPLVLPYSSRLGQNASTSPELAFDTAPKHVPEHEHEGDGGHTLKDEQQIRYCRAPDGVRLAYAVVGRGPPLAKTANWFNHLEYDWRSPVWRHILRDLASDHTLIRYDTRGSGMSDWEVDEVSLDAWVRDLETVVDTVGVDRFPLLGISQGCAISIAYTLRHPERVSHLVLYGGFALGGGKRSPEAREK
jgi:class 3 adenylate cyclase